MSFEQEYETLRSKIVSESSPDGRFQHATELINLCLNYLRVDAEDIISWYLPQAKDKELLNELILALAYSSFLSLRSGDIEEATRLIDDAAKALEENNSPKHSSTVSWIKGTILRRQDRITDALTFFEHCSRQAVAEEDYQMQARCSISIGNIYYDLGNFDQALDRHLNGLALREKTGDETGVALALNNIGNTYVALSNYPQALLYYHKSIEIRKRTNDTAGLAQTLINVGKLHSDFGEYPEALDCFKKALATYILLKNDEGQALCYLNIGVVYTESKKYEDGTTALKQALTIAQKRNFVRIIAFSLLNLGEVYFQVKDFQKAEKMLLEARAAANNAHARNILYLANTNLALILLEDGKYKEALDLLEKDNAELAQFLPKYDLIKNYKAASEAHKALGNYKQAFHYFNKFYSLDKEIVGTKAQQQLSNLRAQNESREREQILNFEKRERELSEQLLNNILPAEVAKELREKGSLPAKMFDDVSVLFTDFKGFTTISERLSPQELVDELDVCFKAFDEIVSSHGIEKIKTVGDAYLAVAGLPKVDEDHAIRVCRAALDIRDFMLQRKSTMQDNTFEVRIGINSGPVVAGIVGSRKFAYDIWGDTVNTAARMEQHGEAGKVNISQSTYQLVKEVFQCTYRGPIQAKNKGKINMYFLER